MTSNLRALAILALSLSPSLALAAPSAQDQLQAVSDRLTKLESKASRLSTDFTGRRGLLGPAEARTRYEDAVFNYLVGEYDKSAVSFYALVESGALDNSDLLADCQWYLGESLYELSQYAVAVPAYEQIVKAGQAHPFFSDAVRRLLEIYGIQRDTDSFDAVYGRYISSGVVAPSDLVRYTVAKAWWHQGRSAKAKGSLVEITAGQYFTRARYLQGTILAQEGDYPAAIEQFQQVLTIPALVEDDRRVAELTRMALGRVYYEIGDYPQAVEYYQGVPPTSPLFADKLYELVWTFIKQEKWANARDQIDIFLVAFPDHRYAVQLKLIGGHLLMKEDNHDEARKVYEEVSQQYAPIQQRLSEIEGNRDEAGEYFTRLAEARVMDMRFDLLPDYTVEMLLQDQGVARSIEIRQQLDSQAEDLAYSQAVLSEIEAVIMSGSESIGTFSKGRSDLHDLQEESLRLQGQILEAELAFLRQKGGSGMDADLDALEKRWQAARDAGVELQSDQATATDVRAISEAQVREVQAQSFRLHEMVQNLQADLTATRRFLKENEPKLSYEDVRTIRQSIEGLERELLSIGQALDRIESPATRRRVLAPLTEQSDGGVASASVQNAYETLQGRMLSLGREVGGGDSSAFFSTASALWERTGALDQTASTTLSSLNVAERRQLEQLKIQLATETSQVARNTSDLSETRREADALAVEVTQRGFANLEATFEDTVLQADMGIVDVYWMEQTEVSDKITETQTERAEKAQELEARFDIIRQKLQE